MNGYVRSKLFTVLVITSSDDSSINAVRKAMSKEENECFNAVKHCAFNNYFSESSNFLAILRKSGREMIDLNDIITLSVDNFYAFSQCISLYVVSFISKLVETDQGLSSQLEGHPLIPHRISSIQ